jgi:small subunit ribosomal protein S20
MVKNLQKKIETALNTQNKEEALAAFDVYKKTIDTVAGKGILHKNTVARKKSRLAKKVNAL